MHLQSVKYTPTPLHGQPVQSIRSRADWLSQLSSTSRLENFATGWQPDMSVWTTQSRHSDPLVASNLFGLSARFARLKIAESTVINLVETSACAGESAQLELALAKARESQKVLDALKVALAQERPDSSLSAKESLVSSQLAESQPLTKGIRLTELSLMVAANLANQMRKNKQLDEALELYLQICKMKPTSSLLLGTQTEVNYPSVRFGLNVANVLAEMGNLSKAIKYYRITLDQIAAASQRNLRLKIMSNISLALINSELLVDAQTSLSLLLSDNLLAPDSKVCNANHHLFGLNLAICLYLRNDKQALMTTLGQLLKVGVCHHYERLIDFSSPQDDLPSSDGEPKPEVGFASWSASHVQQDSTRAERRSADATGTTSKSKQDDSINGWRTQASQSMSALQEDRLESVINRKHNQIASSLMCTCNLIADLSSRTSQATSTVSSDSSTCAQLLAASSAYQTLVHDLTINDTCRTLSKHFRLDEAIGSFRAIDQLIDRLDSARKPTVTAQYAPQAQVRSSLVYTNLCLINMLLGNLERAIEFGRKALKLDESNLGASINLANCYITAERYELAEEIHRHCPVNFLVGYNSLLIDANLKSEPDQLKQSTKSIISQYQKRTFSDLKIRSTDVTLIAQISTILLRSKKYQRSHELLASFMSSKSNTFPEMLLLANRVDQHISTKLEKSTISDLRSVQRQHRYLTSFSERIIALCIANFDYDTAKRLLLECIKNRPQQAKWYQMLAECLWRATDYISAISVYKITLDMFPCNLACLKALVKMLSELGMETEKQKFEARYNKLVNGS